MHVQRGILCLGSLTLLLVGPAHAWFGSSIDIESTSADAATIIIGMRTEGDRQGVRHFRLELKDEAGATAELAVRQGRDRLLFRTMESDYRRVQPGGVVQILKVAPGAYTLGKVSVNWPGLTPGSSMSANIQSGVGYSFQVAPRSIVYVGNYTAIGVGGKNLVGMSMTAGIQVQVADWALIDLQLAQRKMPALNLSDVENLTPQARTLEGIVWSGPPDALTFLRADLPEPGATVATPGGSAAAN